jgi:hypothetical protein
MHVAYTWSGYYVETSADNDDGARILRYRLSDGLVRETCVGPHKTHRPPAGWQIYAIDITNSPTC